MSKYGLNRETPFHVNLVLEIELLGTTTDLSMFNPSAPCCFRTTNLGDNDAMEFGCVDITSEGGDDNGSEYGSIGIETNEGEVSLTGYNAPVLAVRSKDLFGTFCETPRHG